MRVCILSMKGNFNRDLGQGVQIYMHELWTYLQSRMAPHDSVQKAELGTGNNASVRKISFTLLSVMKSFRDYDIVHMPAPVMLNPRTRGSTVTTLHELFMISETNPLLERLTQPGYGPAIAKLSVIDKLIYKQIMGSDYLLPNSSQTMAEAERSGYPRERMFMVSHAIEDEFIRMPLPPTREGHKEFVIGYLGSTHTRKNPEFAIRAFKMTEGKDMRFNLWGKENAALRHMAAADRRISIMGFAPEGRKIAIYDGFDAVVVPSLYEGFGKGVLEAQARGKPVIICKDAQIPKEVRKYCFEAEDEGHMAQIMCTLDEDGYDASLKKKAMDYARGFTWERCIDNTISAYRKMVSN